MTRQTFLRNWHKYTKNVPIDIVKISDSLCIRLHDKYHDFCPITWVAYKKLGVLYPWSNPWEAASKLGLNQKDTANIVAAADKHANIYCPKFNPRTRKALLRG